MKEEKQTPYKQELKDKQKHLKKEIKELERVVYKAGAVMDDEWFKAHKKMCFKNIAYQTITSRLNNLDRPRGGIQSVNIDNYK